MNKSSQKRALGMILGLCVSMASIGTSGAWPFRSKPKSWTSDEIGSEEMRQEGGKYLLSQEHPENTEYADKWASLQNKETEVIVGSLNERIQKLNESLPEGKKLQEIPVDETATAAMANASVALEGTGGVYKYLSSQDITDSSKIGNWDGVDLKNGKMVVGDVEYNTFYQNAALLGQILDKHIKLKNKKEWANQQGGRVKPGESLGFTTYWQKEQKGWLWNSQPRWKNINVRFCIKPQFTDNGSARVNVKKTDEYNLKQFSQNDKYTHDLNAKRRGWFGSYPVKITEDQMGQSRVQYHAAPGKNGPQYVGPMQKVYGPRVLQQDESVRAGVCEIPLPDIGNFVKLDENGRKVPLSQLSPKDKKRAEDSKHYRHEVFLDNLLIKS